VSVTGGRRLQLAWSEHQGRSCLRVSGWTKIEVQKFGGLISRETAEPLAVFISELIESGGDLGSIPPIAGRFEIDDDAIYFIPRFPFAEGMGYSLVVNSAPEAKGDDSREIWTIKHPAKEDMPAADVVAIYPTADQLPVNQLKLYVHFSRPMSEGSAARSVHVRRGDTGQKLEGVFLAMEPELWDPARRRLTLLLDPGRIKRGLVPNLEAGYPLVEGVPVNFTIGADFRDATGQQLREGAERSFEIGPPVRVHVNPADWTIHCPEAGSTDPLTVEFDRPLDHALLQHSLWVNNPAGLALGGQGSAGPGERCWRFQPDSPWKEGQHQVIVDPRLEDLAGNSLIRVFDRDLIKSEDAPADARHFAIDFTCPLPGAPYKTH